MLGLDWSNLSIDHTSNTTLVLGIIYVALILIAEYRIFEKAGEPGWRIIIPFLNMYTFCKITLGNGWLFILEFIPIVGFFVRAVAEYKLGKKFGHGFLFFLGLVFFPFVFELILGYGDDQYNAYA